MAAIIQMIMTYSIVRLLLMLGVGIVTYGSVIAAISFVVGHLKDAYNSLPSTALSLMAIAGVPECLGIITGAIVARASLQFVKRFAILP